MKPPIEVIKVGYWLTEARTTLQGAEGPYDGNSVAWGFAYLTSAVAAIEPAKKALESKLENRQTTVSAGLRLIRSACRDLASVVGQPSVNSMLVDEIADAIGEGHYELSRAIRRLGFDPVTNEDFDALRAPEDKLPGGGGGR